MWGYVVTVTGSWGRSQNPGFWLVWKAPSGPSRGELAPPVPFRNPGTNQGPVPSHPHTLPKTLFLSHL